MPSIYKRHEENQARLIEFLRHVQEAKETGLEQTRLLFAEFRERLETMIATEEKVVFPRLDGPEESGKAGASAVMRVEHRLIRQLLDEIGEKLLTGDMETDAEQIVLLELLCKHLQRERIAAYAGREEPPEEADR